MRLSQAWTVARHDMRLIRRKRGIMAGLIGMPIGVGVGFPALVALLLSQGGSNPASWLPTYIEAFSFWFVIGAASLPNTIASFSIVGEKVSKSLEPLLATPTSDGEILVGKALAAFVPTMLAVWAGSVIFQVLIDVETLGPFGYLFFPDWTIAIELFVLVPLAALLAIEASVIISSRVTDIRSAQQYAGLIFLPLIVVYVASEIVGLTSSRLLYIGGALAAIVLVLYYASLRTFHREEILTRWK
jgi:ABC-2 type transport system permease protein